MARVKRVGVEGPSLILMWTCPGCGQVHQVNAARWNWNGDLDRPTLSPSVRHFYEHPERGRVTTCHYFVRRGRVWFCADCPHDAAGETRDMYEIQEV